MSKKILLSSKELDISGGKRVVVITKSERKCQHVACGNPPSEKLPQAILDRFYRVEYNNNEN